MEINPLNVLHQRQLDWLPEHFTSVEVSDTNTLRINTLSQWIYSNLKSRFCVVNTLNYNTVIFGFEDGAEASYFALIQQNIK